MKNLKFWRKAAIFFTLSLVIILITGCKTLDIKPQKPGTAVLYVIREDALASYGHVVKVYLNDQFAVELKREEYAALHLKTGKYEIKWDIRKKDNQLIKEHVYSGTLSEGETRSSMIAYNFGWKGWKRFMKGGSITAKFKFVGEIDLTNKIKPQ